MNGKTLTLSGDFSMAMEKVSATEGLSFLLFYIGIVLSFFGFIVYFILRNKHPAEAKTIRMGSTIISAIYVLSIMVAIIHAIL
jgi:hypothetical protein